MLLGVIPSAYIMWTLTGGILLNTENTKTINYLPQHRFKFNYKMSATRTTCIQVYDLNYPKYLSSVKHD